jgi:hypothetical protein
MKEMSSSASDSLAELMNVTKRCMMRLSVSVVILMVFYCRTALLLVDYVAVELP